MDLDEYLPLTETSFYILLSLAALPKHGYAIIKEVEAMSEGRVILATGTLYSAIRRMLEEGWIERVNQTDPNPDQRERKLYQLSQKGRQILSAEIDRLQKLVRLTQRVDAGSAQ